MCCLQDAIDDIQGGYARLEGIVMGPIKLAKTVVEKSKSAAAQLPPQQQEPSQPEASES